MRPVFIIMLLSALAAAGCLPGARAELPRREPLHVTRITPEGEDVAAGRQVVIQFNRPVVPVGRMQRRNDEIPIEIVPALACRWQWLNRSALACQLDAEQAMTPGTSYSLTVKPGIYAEDGATLEEPYRHRFVTRRPQVRHAQFETWKSPGYPVIRLTFDQSVTRESVRRHVYMEYRAGSRRGRMALRVEPDPHDSERPRFVPLPGEKQIAVDFGEAQTVSPDDRPLERDGHEARRIWQVEPIGELRLDTAVELKVEPGLMSAEGQEPGVEERVVAAFHTFPEFAFLGVRCQTLEKQRVLITPAGENAERRCDPLGGTALVFSAPVVKDQIKRHVKITPDLAGRRKDYDPWANVGDYSRLQQPHVQGRVYEVLLPEILKAARTYRVEMPAAEQKGLEKLKELFEGPRPAVEDEFGRRLPAPLEMAFHSDHRRPDFTLVHRTAVIEQGVDSEVPLYVTNLDRVRVDYRRLSEAGRETGLQKTLAVPEADDISFAIPLETRAMLEGRSGVVYGRLSTTPAVKKSEQERTLFAQVTPYAVHVKFGHFNTVVWVSDLASGLPVQGARVSVYKDAIQELAPAPKNLAEAVTSADGIALLPGSEKLDPTLETFGWRCHGDHCPRLIVRVDGATGMALMPLEPRFYVDTYRASEGSVYASTRRLHGHIHTWGTTAQGVYRAGDTIQYKIYVRNQGNEGYIPAPKKRYALTLFDPAGTKVHVRKEIILDDFGAIDGEIPIAKTGAVGWYRFQLAADFTDYTWSPMQVLVSDFTPSPFRVSTELNGDRFSPGQKVEVVTAARLHSGGGYRDAETRVTAILRETAFFSDHPQARGFRFDTWRDKPQKTLFQQTGLVDEKGEKSTSFTLPKADILYGTLTVESAVRDDRGKYVADSRSAGFVGADRFVGLKSDQWLFHEDRPAKVHWLVVDEAGAPAAGTPVTVRIERLETKAARVKGVGNAYLTHFIDEWVTAGECTGSSGTEPETCTFTPDRPGSYRLTAAIEDSGSTVQSTELRVYVAGKGRVVWSEAEDNALSIVPERSEYKIGETARYLVRNPYPGAQALVTVERYGVLRRWTRVLEGSTPVIEFPVEPDMMPGYFLSVAVVSPRVEAPPPEGTVDLGKPAFRMGYAAAEVKDPHKEIQVSVTPERETYKPRETVRARLHAEAAVAGGNGEPVQLAVAVLDEAVFDLIRGGRDYYDPYHGFNRLDGLDLANYNLLTRLVGRQKFEKKGANAGGDGGADLAMRSLFKFVSYWNPALRTDADGNAEIEYEVPDNLTGWRILALAVTPADRMGLGDAGFRVNRPTELRPVMPNQVTEGDEFTAGFSVMNRTDKRRTLAVEIEAAGDVDAKKRPPALKTEVALEPFQRRSVWIPVATRPLVPSRATGSGAVRFKVSARDDMDGDALGHVLPVNRRRSLQTGASYGSSDDGQIAETVRFPEGIHTDIGDLSVMLSPTVIANVDGAFRYLRDYPYTCWEQILSKGVMAAHFLELKDYAADDFHWPEVKDVPEETLKQAAAYQAPNGGMAYFLPRDTYVSPFLSAYTALAFAWLSDAGHAIPQAVETKLHGYLANLLREEVFPDFYTRGMASSVRAVALAALARRGKISRQDLDRYRPHIPYMDLFGKAHFLQAALSVNDAGDVAEEAEKAILAASVQSGGKFLFNEELDDSYTRILSTPLRANCAVLSALVGAKDAPGSGADVAQIPLRMVRAITQARGNRDHWENTQENMFCMKALVDYSRVYEKERPDMAVTVTLDRKLFGQTRFVGRRERPVTVRRFIKEQDPGRSAELRIERKGKGRLYYGTRLTYAPLAENAERVNVGIDIRREYSVEREGEWRLLKEEGEIRRGELVRVDIFLSLPVARHFVVVDDPVPGGLEPVNRDLATGSAVDADKGVYQAAGGSWWFKFGDWQEYGLSRWSFYHQELRHDSVRFYSDYLPAGNYHLVYTAQAIAVGRFSRLPVHAEEMYDPDVYGKGLPSTLEVVESPPAAAP